MLWKFLLVKVDPAEMSLEQKWSTWKNTFKLYRVAERMNPEESESKITVYGQEILVPSFGRAQPSYPLKIGKHGFMLIKNYFSTNIVSLLTF